MNIYNLKYFADSARLGSITKAAELNHISRPAISQAIQKLEDELGVQLLEHKRRTFALTEAGRTLLAKSEEVFQCVENVKFALSENAKRTGDFRIGCARTLATFQLQNAILELQEQYPDIRFKVVLDGSESLVKKLENREIDVALFLGDDALNGFKQVVVSKGSYCFVKPKKAVAGLRYAITERRPETERLKVLYERMFTEALPVFAEIPSWDAIWTWIRTGSCGGLIPDFLIEADPESAKHIAIVIPKVFPYEIKIMYSKTKARDPLIKRFTETLSS